MTIAAGFVCTDGVLLCADTEYSTWTNKFQDSKLESFEVSAGKLTFAVAGYSSFAWSAVQKCQENLKNTPVAKFVSRLEETLESEYRRHVLSNPNPADLHYWLLVGVWLSSENRVTLYITDQTSFRKVQGFECIGVGSEYALSVIRHPNAGQMTLRDTLVISSYALAKVKQTVRDCDGMSLFMLLTHDGQVSIQTSLLKGLPERVEQYSSSYDLMTKNLFAQLADESIEYQDFETYLLETFNRQILSKRSEWEWARMNYEKELVARNAQVTPREARRLYLQLSIGLLPLPQPSQE